ncbi:MAG: hypothetical protein WBF77_08000 [Sulfurimonadaceae bacterium]
MTKVILILIFISNLMYASSVTAQYDVDFSVVGTIAKASMNKVVEGDDYVITLEAHAIGIAAEMTKDRSETYISQGSVVGSEFIPDVLVVKRKTKDKEKYTIFKFDHKNKVVQKDSSEVERVCDKSIDVISMRIISTEKEEFSFSSVKNDIYARNDIVSLLFNSRYYIGTMSVGERKKLRAVGIKTDEGELMISLPARGAVIDNIDKTGVSKNDLFGIAINKDYFENGKGELVVKLDPDGFPSRAVMNDVALYGDVVGKRVYTELVSN